jgi:hypothetical protein
VGTPLHVAATLGKMKAANCLVQSGIDLDCQDEVRCQFYVEVAGECLGSSAFFCSTAEIQLYILLVVMATVPLP